MHSTAHTPHQASTINSPTSTRFSSARSFDPRLLASLSTTTDLPLLVAAVRVTSDCAPALAPPTAKANNSRPTSKFERRPTQLTQQANNSPIARGLSCTPTSCSSSLVESAPLLVGPRFERS